MPETSFWQPPLFQQLVQERDLVTYWRPWRTASSTGDFSPATDAPAPCWRGHGSNPGCPPWPTTGAGSPPCGPCDSLASNSTSDASGCRDGDGTTPCSASREEEAIGPRAVFMAARRPSENSEPREEQRPEEDATGRREQELLSEWRRRKRTEEDELLLHRHFQTIFPPPLANRETAGSGE